MDHITTFLQSKLTLGQSAAAEASSGLVSASDFQAILPALVFIATGTLLLMLDCFSRGLSHTDKTRTDRSSLSTAINFIGLLARVADADPNIAPVSSALETLAGLYEDRQQYPRAAGYWKQAINRFGPGNNNHRRDRLEQIVANWGQFDNARVYPAGRAAS